MKSVEQVIATLACTASVEINVVDTSHLPASMQYLALGTKLYVSHLPRQNWQQTVSACHAVRTAGLHPVPHIPVRLIESVDEVTGLIEQLVAMGVQDILLIAGDHPKPRGPFACVSDVLRTIDLAALGLTRLSFAGHPEGHPVVPLAEIRRAERQKVNDAHRARLQPTLLTQFFFESRPFVQWVHELNTSHLDARLVAGLAGPAQASTLLKLALRCGVGASLRALTQRPNTLRLLGEHGPERIIRDLAQAQLAGEINFAGIHLFCFGGFVNTCRWLNAIAKRRFRLTHDAFDVDLGQL